MSDARHWLENQEYVAISWTKYNKQWEAWTAVGPDRDIIKATGRELWPTVNALHAKVAQHVVA